MLHTSSKWYKMYTWHSPERIHGNKLLSLEQKNWAAFSCLICCAEWPTKMPPKIPPACHVAKNQNCISASFWGLGGPRKCLTKLGHHILCLVFCIASDLTFLLRYPASLPALPLSSKTRAVSTPIKQSTKLGTQGVQASYDTELPPFISIVRHPGRPVIIGRGT